MTVLLWQNVATEQKDDSPIIAIRIASLCGTSDWLGIFVNMGEYFISAHIHVMSMFLYD